MLISRENGVANGYCIRDNALGETRPRAFFKCCLCEVSRVSGVWISLVDITHEHSVLVQRQLAKVRMAANEWVLFWLRLVLRVSLAWRRFWSRAAKMASSLPARLSAGGDGGDRGVKAHGIVVFDETGD